MAASLTSDSRGVILTCPACGTANRVAYTRLGQSGRCGTCKADLPAAVAPVEVSSAESFAALAGQGGLPVLVDFWAEWCGPCKMIAPVLDELAAEYVGKARIAKVNIDDGDNAKIAARFNIQSIPTFLVFKGGQVVAQFVGIAGGKPKLKSLLDGALT